MVKKEKELVRLGKQLETFKCYIFVKGQLNYKPVKKQNISFPWQLSIDQDMGILPCLTFLLKS